MLGVWRSDHDRRRNVDRRRVRDPRHCGEGSPLRCGRRVRDGGRYAAVSAAAGCPAAAARDPFSGRGVAGHRSATGSSVAGRTGPVGSAGERGGADTDRAGYAAAVSRRWARAPCDADRAAAGDHTSPSCRNDAGARAPTRSQSGGSTDSELGASAHSSRRHSADRASDGHAGRGSAHADAAAAGSARAAAVVGDTVPTHRSDAAGSATRRVGAACRAPASECGRRFGADSSPGKRASHAGLREWLADTGSGSDQSVPSE